MIKDEYVQCGGRCPERGACVDGAEAMKCDELLEWLDGELDDTSRAVDAATLRDLMPAPATTTQ